MNDNFVILTKISVTPKLIKMPLHFETTNTITQPLPNQNLLHAHCSVPTDDVP